MHDTLYSRINELLEGKQLSISAITRNLKEIGVDEHRLIMTGYLRALRDMGKLAEIEIPPSKVYSKIQESESEDKLDDLYSVLSKYIIDIEADMRLPVVVHIFTSLLERPIFREEITRIGLSSKTISEALHSSEALVVESSNESLKEYIAGISRIKIPLMDPAYEIGRETPVLTGHSNTLLIRILKSSVDVSGMIPKTKKTRIDDYFA